MRLDLERLVAHEGALSGLLIEDHPVGSVDGSCLTRTALLLLHQFVKSLLIKRHTTLRKDQLREV